MKFGETPGQGELRGIPRESVADIAVMGFGRGQHGRGAS